MIPDSFQEPIAAVQRLLDRFAQRGVIIGGIAASLLGEPRATADIDAVLVLSIDELPHLLEVARLEGLSPRIADAETFARRHRVLLLHHDATKINVDISLGVLPFEVETVERGRLYRTDQMEIRLPTPEDLIIQKAVAHRPKDLADIEAVVASQPKLDWDRIRYWVQQFAEVLEMPELWQDISRFQPKAKRK